MMKKRMNMKEWRERHCRARRRHEPVIKLVALREGKIVISIDGQEREVECGAMIDPSRLEDDRMKEKIEMMQWLEEHPESVSLGFLARQYCRLYEIPYKEELNGVSWSYDNDRKRVLVHDRPWYYTTSVCNYIVYGHIETPASRFGVRYMTGDASKLLFRRLTEAIRMKTESLTYSHS